MEFVGPSLRDRLRTGTRLSQDSLERAQRSFDLEVADDMTAFLAAQRDAVVTLQGCAPDLERALEEAYDRLDADLADRAGAARPKAYPKPRVDHPFACGYVWHSQQLSLRMTCRRLPEAATAGIRFLAAPRDAEAWRALCDALERTPGYDADADRAVMAANDRLALLETIHLDHARAPR